MPAGTLRKVGGSEPAGTGWVGGRQEAQDALARPLAATGTVAGRGKAAAGMQMSPNVPKYPGLSCLGFPPGGSVGGNARMSKGLRFWLRCSGPEQGGVGGLRGVPAKGHSGWQAGGGGGLGLWAADKAKAPPRGADQWNEWAINSGQWAARAAPLKSRGSAARPLFACAALPGLPKRRALL